MLQKIVEIAAYEPKDIRCHDCDEAQNEEAFDDLLVLIVTVGVHP